MRIKHTTIALAVAVFGAAFAVPADVRAASGASEYHAERQTWSFGGIFGQYDKAQLRRGYQVYQEICSGCHSMTLLSYRNLVQPGGPELDVDKIKEMVAELEVPGGFNDDGEPVMRPAKLSDRFVSPYANDKEAMAANGGSFPPDLSVMAKARGLHVTHEGFTGMFSWMWGVAVDIMTQYQEAGPDYLYALMTGFLDEPPEGSEVPEGKYYNKFFPGNAIGMPPQLMEDLVEYEDGTAATVDQLGKDVSAFLMWASEPTLNQRKKLGLKVLLYMIILSVLLYMVKRAVWSRVRH
jgi:cytochrome c1